MQNIEISPHNSVGSPSAPPVLPPPVFPSRLLGLGRWSEEGWIAQVSLCTHDTVGARGLERLFEILVLKDVTVCEQHSFWGRLSPRYRIIFQSARPVKWPFCSLLLPCTVNMLAPAFSTFRAYLQRGFLCVQDSNLGRHGNGEVLVKVVDEIVDELLVFLQERRRSGPCARCPAGTRDSDRPHRNTEQPFSRLRGGTEDRSRRTG